MKELTDFLFFISSGILFHVDIARTVKKCFLLSSLTVPLNNTSLRSLSPSSFTVTVARVALLVDAFLKLNQSDFSTLLKPLIVLKVSTASPRSRRSVSVVNPMLLSLSSYELPTLSDTNLTSRFWTRSSVSLSFSVHGDQAATACSILGLTNVL